MSPLTFDAAAAHRIRLVGLDVDGVLTDGMVYVGSTDGHEVELKRFDIRDSIGIKFMKRCGITVVLVSGRFSHATLMRAQELGIDDVVQDNGAAKLEPFARLLDKYGVQWEEAAFMGDDLPDLPVLRRVGLSVTVSDASADVRRQASAVTNNPGGSGAVREFAEALLHARGEWDATVEAYLAERGEAAEVAP